jgi:hypothetical protein
MMSSNDSFAILLIKNELHTIFSYFQYSFYTSEDQHMDYSDNEILHTKQCLVLTLFITYE